MALKPTHLKRYRDLAGLLIKYKRSGLADAPTAEDPDQVAPDADTGSS